MVEAEPQWAEDADMGAEGQEAGASTCLLLHAAVPHDIGCQMGSPTGNSTPSQVRQHT